MGEQVVGAHLAASIQLHQLDGRGFPPGVARVALGESCVADRYRPGGHGGTSEQANRFRRDLLNAVCLAPELVPRGDEGQVQATTSDGRDIWSGALHATEDGQLLGPFRHVSEPPRTEVEPRPQWPEPHVAEVAAWRLDEVLGLDLVPRTVTYGRMGSRGVAQEMDATRSERPPADPGIRYFLQDEQERMAVFDYLLGVTNRPEGSYLVDQQGRPRSVGHETAFPVDPGEVQVNSPYVREFAGRSLSEARLQALEEVAADELARQLRMTTLPDASVQGVIRRREDLLETGGIPVHAATGAADDQPPARLTVADHRLPVAVPWDGTLPGAWYEPEDDPFPGVWITNHRTVWELPVQAAAGGRIASWDAPDGCTNGVLLEAVDGATAYHYCGLSDRDSMFDPDPTDGDRYEAGQVLGFLRWGSQWSGLWFGIRHNHGTEGDPRWVWHCPAPLLEALADEAAGEEPPADVTLPAGSC